MQEQDIVSALTSKHAEQGNVCLDKTTAHMARSHPTRCRASSEKPDEGSNEIRRGCAPPTVQCSTTPFPSSAMQSKVVPSTSKPEASHAPVAAAEVDDAGIAVVVGAAVPELGVDEATEFGDDVGAASVTESA